MSASHIFRSHLKSVRPSLVPNFQRKKNITPTLTMEYTEYSKHHSTKPEIPMISQKSQIDNLDVRFVHLKSPRGRRLSLVPHSHAKYENRAKVIMTGRLTSL
mmetsp:Transcript_11887/g.21972  ORF Transcript_11887/g.21972 Transcript_11887/m.21972 type:complete len:102 (-) Transcript_11887:598-903(-)